MKNSPSEGRVVPCGSTDGGRTDTTKPTVALHNFANAPKKAKQLCQSLRPDCEGTAPGCLYLQNQAAYQMDALVLLCPFGQNSRTTLEIRKRPRPLKSFVICRSQSP
jgi:hypothetical protein